MTALGVTRDDVSLYMRLILQNLYWDTNSLERALEEAMDVVDGYVERELALDSLYIADEMVARAAKFTKEHREGRQARHVATLDDARRM